MSPIWDCGSLSLECGISISSDVVIQAAIHGLAERLIICAAQGHQENITSLRRCALAVNRVVEYVRSARDPTSELTQLCRIARVSEQTLQYAFKEHYGIPPNVFVKKMEPELSSTPFATSRPGRDKRERYCIETWFPLVSRVNFITYTEVRIY